MNPSRLLLTDNVWMGLSLFDVEPSGPIVYLDEEARIQETTPSQRFLCPLFSSDKIQDLDKTIIEMIISASQKVPSHSILESELIQSAEDLMRTRDNRLSAFLSSRSFKSDFPIIESPLIPSDIVIAVCSPDELGYIVRNYERIGAFIMNVQGCIPFVLG